MAVGLVVLLLEGALVELLQAEGADKVLRVELLEHGRDTAACDGLLAAEDREKYHNNNNNNNNEHISRAPFHLKHAQLR